jgi:predicted nucleic acid-binding protein
MKALLDTNILIDYLNGIRHAKDEIRRYERPLISMVTWMEVMVGVRPEDEAVVRSFLSGFDRVDLDQGVAEQAVELRQRHRLRLPDAIIWASARRQGALLVTRNTKDLPPEEPDVRIPYSL